MKKLLFILSITILASCSSNDDSGDVNDDQFQNIETILPQGTWEVSSYFEGNTDRTMDFESFVFTFDQDNTLKAKNDLFTENGTWEYQNSESNPDGNDERLLLEFGGTTPFDLITEDWGIISVSSTKVELSVASGNNGKAELLTFSKL